MAYTKKPKKAKAENDFNVQPRDLTVAQTRELFLKKKKELSNDFRVIKEGEDENLTPFNLLALDWGLRLYGLAGRGAVYHLHGEEGSGKSTLTYAINREYQRYTQMPIAIFDFERTTTSSYLRSQGVDENMAFVKRPDSVEDAVKNAIDMMSQGVRLFTFDSIPRMRSIVELEDIQNGNAFKVQPGTHSRTIQQFYDIILPYIARVDGALIMVNQQRSRIEMTPQAQAAAKGMDTVTNLNYSLPGGRANRYAANVMIELSRKKAYRPGICKDEWLLESGENSSDEYLAMESKLRTLKNKVSGTGFRESSIWLRPHSGIDDTVSIRQYARELGMISYHGKTWYVGRNIDEAVIRYNSKSAALDDLVEKPNPEIMDKLKELVAQAILADATIGSVTVSDDERQYLEGETDIAADQDNAIPASMIELELE